MPVEVDLSPKAAEKVAREAAVQTKKMCQPPLS